MQIWVFGSFQQVAVHRKGLEIMNFHKPPHHSIFGKILYDGLHLLQHRENLAFDLFSEVENFMADIAELF